MSLRKQIKSQFDYDVSGLTNYVEEKEDQVLVLAVTGAPTLDAIRVETGIKGTQRVHTLDADVNYQDASSCGLENNGDVTLGEFDLTTHAIGYKMKFCNKDLIGKYPQTWLTAGAQAEDENLPIEERIINRIVTKNNFELEKLIWRGDSALSSGNLQFFNGFKTLFDASSIVTELNGFGGSNIVANITSANAYDVFYSVAERMDAVNEGIADSGEMIIFTDRTKFSMLTKNLVGLNLFHFDPDSKRSRYEIEMPGTDIKVRVATGLSGAGNGGIYVGKSSELTFGTDLESDSDSFRIWYSEDDDVIYVQNKFRAGVNVPFFDQIGKFTITGSSSL
jgi:hypothetical protein